MFFKNRVFGNFKKNVLCLVIFCITCGAAFSASAGTKMSKAEALVAREKFVAEIRNQINKPFKQGTAGPDSFDNAGLVCYAASVIGNKLPKTVKAIYNDVKIIPDEKKETGDLLFFKSTEGSISFIGVFIGGDKFVISLGGSDNKTENEDGVMIQSLLDEKWRGVYAAAGQFIVPAKDEVSEADEVQKTPADEKKASSKDSDKVTAEKKQKVVKQPKSSGTGSVKDDILFDFSVFFDWSLLSPRQFVFRFRGIDALAGVSYAGWALEPGIGIAFRYNYGLDTIQIPVTVSMRLHDYIKVYGGPVFTCGSVKLIDTDKQIKGSVFPGVVGVSFITPSYNFGAFEIKGVQDVSYTIYNNLNGSSLSFMESMAAGLVMYTGVRITFPLSVFGK